MRSAHLFLLIPTLVAACAVTGCNQDSTRSEYPDRSEETKAQADGIRREQDERNVVIARDLQQNRTALAFEEGQIERKAKQEREGIALERDQVVQPLSARQDDAKAASRRDHERITKDGDAKLATLNGEEATRVKAGIESEIAEAKRNAAEVIANAELDIAKATQAAAVRLANVDAGEAKEKAAIALRREEAERLAREERLAVATHTTARLDQIGRQSAKRTERDRENEAVTNQVDEQITTAVRQDLARHGEPARGVSVITHAGVVVLSGKVTNDAVRQKIVSDASRINGVVRVDDRLALH